jgi:hypothetical protein
MEPLYGFRSLHAFKTKFEPWYAPMHVAYRDEADLPRIGVALARAYVPDTSLVTVLVAFAAVTLLFTGTYPRGMDLGGTEPVVEPPAEPVPAHEPTGNRG